jgi:glycosyltransferase involved in cell wall biosynthesis
VATDVGGVRHVLGEAGWLVPPGNPAAVADALRQVLADPAAAAARAASARRSVLARFDASRSAAAHAALFDELLAGRR